jgi:hypothetical protein
VGLCVEQNNNIYVVDNFDYRVNRISPAGVVTFLGALPAASRRPVAGIWNRGPSKNPAGIAVDRTGTLYVTDGATVQKGSLPLQIYVFNVAGTTELIPAKAAPSVLRFSHPITSFTQRRNVLLLKLRGPPSTQVKLFVKRVASTGGHDASHSEKSPRVWLKAPNESPAGSAAWPPFFNGPAFNTLNATTNIFPRCFTSGHV